MNTMVLQIENESLIPTLKKLFMSLDGVSVIPKHKVKEYLVDVPNSTTIKAIQDVRAGKTHKATSASDLLKQCLD